MLTIGIRRASIAVAMADRFDDFVAAVPAPYAPVLRSSLELQAQLLGVDASRLFPHDVADGPLYPELSQVYRAELFTDKTGLYVASLVAVRSDQKDPDYLPEKLSFFLHALGYGNTPLALEPFEHAAEQVFEVTPTKTRLRSSKFEALPGQGLIGLEPPSGEELEACKLLADRPTRALAVAIKSGGGLLVSDIPRQVAEADRPFVNDMQASLQKAGIVDSEIVVICRKTSAQVARLPNEASLPRLEAEGLKCACGRPITSERTEKAVAITDLGRRLLDGSAWLSIMVMDVLKTLDVGQDQILLDQQLGPDEMDCLASIGEELILMELKAKEFSLGNAYSFGAKIAIYEPDQAIIVTTEAVANDAKEHFLRARLAGDSDEETSAFQRWRDTVRRLGSPPRMRPLMYVEGLNQLHDHLEQVVSAAHALYARLLLSRILPSAALDIDALMGAMREMGPIHVVRPPRPLSQAKGLSPGQRSAVGKGRGPRTGDRRPRRPKAGA
jgi:hypothetical protein